MPPFVLLELVGPAVALHNGETLAAAFPDRFYVSENLRRIVVEHKMPGYYILGPTGDMVPDPEVVDAHGRSRPSRRCAPSSRCARRCSRACAEEARIMLDEGVVSAPRTSTWP